MPDFSFARYCLIYPGKIFFGGPKVANVNNIRNIVLLGHAGSGKTSLAEAILHKTGAINRLGSVDEKTSVCDYYEEERQHQHVA